MIIVMTLQRHDFQNAPRLGDSGLGDATQPGSDSHDQTNIIESGTLRYYDIRVIIQVFYDTKLEVFDFDIMTDIITRIS